MNKYIEVRTRLKAGGFKPLPKSCSLGHMGVNAEQMRANLWSMFKLRFTTRQLMSMRAKGEERFGSCVSDYAWSAKVREEFYEHPYHRRLVKQMKGMGGLTWGMWCLDVEPSDILDEDIIKLNKKKRKSK